MLYGLLITLFVIICILMVVTILLQASKGGGLAASFGGGGAAGGMGGVLGARGATTFLQKLTVGLGLAYGILCLIISLVGVDGSETSASRTQQLLQQQQQVAPPADLPDVTTPSGNLPLAPAEEGATDGNTGDSEGENNDDTGGDDN